MKIFSDFTYLENSITFHTFLKIGRESRFQYKNPLIRGFISLYGPLGITSRIRNGHVLNLLGRLGIPKDGKILDAGCGQAYSSFWLAQHNPDLFIKGVDLDEITIKTNQEIVKKLNIENLEFYCEDLSKLEELDYFDVIYSMDVLEHIPDDLAVLNKFRQALKPTGILILHLPRRYSEAKRYLPGFYFPPPSDHVRQEYTLEEIEEKLIRSGFQPVHMRYGFSWLGELSFELNYLLWRIPLIRKILAVITHPLVVWLGYLEVTKDYSNGNSLVILARPQKDSSILLVGR